MKTIKLKLTVLLATLVPVEAVSQDLFPEVTPYCQQTQDNSLSCMITSVRNGTLAELVGDQGIDEFLDENGFDEGQFDANTIILSFKPYVVRAPEFTDIFTPFCQTEANRDSCVANARSVPTPLAEFIPAGVSPNVFLSQNGYSNDYDLTSELPANMFLLQRREASYD